MAYAVEMYFDPAAEFTVRQVWQALSEAGVGRAIPSEGFRPHVSLGVCDALLHPAELARELKPVLLAASPISINFQNIGVFPTTESVVFFGATVTSELLALHEAFSGVFNRHATDAWGYYKPGRWVPHCTLALGLSRNGLVEAVKIAWFTKLPILATVREVGIVRTDHADCEALELIELAY